MVARELSTSSECPGCDEEWSGTLTARAQLALQGLGKAPDVCAARQVAACTVREVCLLRGATAHLWMWLGGGSVSMCSPSADT